MLSAQVYKLQVKVNYTYIFMHVYCVLTICPPG